VSSLRDTASACTWSGRMRRGAGSEGAGNAGEPAGGNGNAGGAADGNGNAGGAADEHAGGAAGGNGDAGDPPPPGSGPPTEHRDRNPRQSPRQGRIQELQYAKPIGIKEPKQFEGKPGEDFDTWWIMMEVYIHDQPEKFPKNERTIDWIGSLMDTYAAAWHIQWIQGTLSGKYPKSITGCIQELKLRFEDEDAKDVAYADLERGWYEGCIGDMFTTIHMYNAKAMVSGAALTKFILDRLPRKGFEQMHVIDLTGKTNEKIIIIITNVGRTAEKWNAARKNLGLKRSISGVRQETKKQSRPFKQNRFDEPKEFHNKIHNRNKSNHQFKDFKMHNKSSKTYAEQTEGIDKSELDRRQAAGECPRCAWPADRKRSRKTMIATDGQGRTKERLLSQKPKEIRSLKLELMIRRSRR